MAQKCAQRNMGDVISLCLMLEGIRMDLVKEFEQKKREEFKEKNGLGRGIKRKQCRAMIHLCWNLGYRAESN